jgi:hypothetical protein
VQKRGAAHYKLPGQGKPLSFGNPHGGAENYELVFDPIVVRGPPAQPALERLFRDGIHHRTELSPFRRICHKVETTPGHRLEFRGQNA